MSSPLQVGDTVVENPNEGTDKVQASVTYTLADNLENLTLTGTNPVDGTGNSLNNTITGNRHLQQFLKRGFKP